MRRQMRTLQRSRRRDDRTRASRCRVAKPVLVIGSLNMDLVARCEHLPRTGQTVFGTDFFTAAGGKGANQAVAAARLGARVAMAGCVGDDQFGRDLVAGLRRDGVRSDAVQAAALPTGTALITIDAEGANTIVVISGANAACDTGLVDRALAGAGGPGSCCCSTRYRSRRTRTRSARRARRGGSSCSIRRRRVRWCPRCCR